MAVTTRNPRTRGARAPLSKERIFDAAVTLVDGDGIEALSMRRLGAALGVEAMSLYNHVPNKAAIVDGIVERIIAEIPEPPTDLDDWADRIRFLARALRGVAQAHPRAFALVAAVPMKGPGALRPVEGGLALLRRAGFSRRDALLAFGAVVGYVLGFALRECRILAGEEPAFGFPDPGEVGAEFPHVMEALPEARRLTPDHEFEFGLDLLVAGLRARAPRVRRARAS